MSLHLVHDADNKDLQKSANEQGARPRTSIRLINLLVAYDSDFELRCRKLTVSGNVIALIGHNGAGKSTFLKAMLNLLPIKSGRIGMVMEKEGTKFSLLPERHLAFCPENGAVFADISVESYIKLWCRFRHRNPRYYLEEGSRFIELLQLQPLLRKLGRELSKGQRRRVQTAVGFFMKPELFLLDEPFDGLDVQKTHELAEIIETHSFQMSFIISSHRMDVIERLADSIIVLDQGSILTHGNVKSVASALAGKSIVITIGNGIERGLTNLKQHFPQLLVNHIGNRIVVTGEGIPPQLLKDCVRAIGATIMDIEESPPSLVDAMNYHLRKGSLPSKV